MIFDRTAADVEAAKSIRLNKVQKGEALTGDDIAVLERGTMTTVTLNRIEEKQAELKELLNDAGYYNTDISSRVWGYTDIFNITEFKRLLGNLNVLKAAFFVYSGTPETPYVSFGFEDINSLEKILFDLETMIGDMKIRYRQCGTFECGEVNKN